MLDNTKCCVDKQLRVIQGYEGETIFLLINAHLQLSCVFELLNSSGIGRNQLVLSTLLLPLLGEVRGLGIFYILPTIVVQEGVVAISNTVCIQPI